MKSFIVKQIADDTFFPMTDTLAEHIECIKRNIQPKQCCIGGYLAVSEKTSQKRHQILCDMIDCIASTNTGRKILTMTSETVQIYALSKRSKEDGDNFGESYGPEQCMVISPKLLCVEMYEECVDTLAHEMTHLIHDNLKRRVLKTSYNSLNPYDEFCLNFFDEVSAHICGARVASEYIHKPHKTISVADIMTSKMYWHWLYGDILWQLTDYRRPFRQTKASHTPSYYKLWRAYFEMHPELKWPELVRHVQLGARKMMKAIRYDMLSHDIEPNGKKLVDRYYPLLRHLRKQMIHGYERV